MDFATSYEAAAAHWPAGSARIEVPTSWGRTHLLAAGPASAPAVVLLHGDGATATAWAGVAAALADRFRVLAPDQPGNPGRSGSSRPFRSTADQAGWLGEVLAGTTDGPFHLAGHSAGAHLALSYALAGAVPRPTSLALLDPTACFAGFSPRYLLHAAPSLLRPSATRIRRFLAWETGGRPLDPAWVEVYVRGATESPRTPIVRTRRPSAADLAALDVPTLVVVAGRSRAHDPATVAAAAARLPTGEVQVLPEATHHTVPVRDATPIAAAIGAHANRAAAR
ncbi:alpha/beta fold hydrolase [Blastococcus sp. SYSU DS0619]